MNSADIKTALRRLRHPGSEWVWCEELKTGVGLRQTEGYIDAWAMHMFPSKGNQRTTYEVKISRSDFKRELRKPHKRRIGLMLSNHFYFVAPLGVLKPADIPPECGLIEVQFGDYGLRQRFTRQNRPRSFHADDKAELWVTLPAPWRDTSPPPWCFLAAVARNVSNGYRK